MTKIFNSRLAVGLLVSVPLLVLIFTITTPTGDFTQDINFRLLNIERRLDQLQQRVDFIERNLQNQSMSRPAESNIPSPTLLEIQRQQISQAEQLVLLQRKMLELQKSID